MNRIKNSPPILSNSVLKSNRVLNKSLLLIVKLRFSSPKHNHSALHLRSFTFYVHLPSHTQGHTFPSLSSVTQTMCTCMFFILRVAPDLWLAFHLQTSNLWPTFCFEDIRSIICLICSLHLSTVDLLSRWQLTVYWTPVIAASDPIKYCCVQNRRDLISMCWENVGLDGQTRRQQE